MVNESPAGTVCWDFDGTLAYSHGKWSALLLEVLDQFRPDHGLTLDQIRPHLSYGFPWHTPEVPHPELCESARWWASMESALSAALQKLAVPASASVRLAHEVRARYIVPDRWVLFDDAVPALDSLTAAGWGHIILSNHVPELPDIVQALGIGHYFHQILTSASLGYEKPHPEAFRCASEAITEVEGPVWMVGDNVRADVLGAQAAGFKGILVRAESGHPVVQAAGLAEAVQIIASVPAVTDGT